MPSQLLKAVGVDVVTDYAKYTFSTYMFLQYHNAMLKYILVDGKGKEKSTSTVSTFKWKAHNESCKVDV